MRANPERVAWRVMIASFAAFLLLCGGSIYLVQWYFFESDIDLTAELMPARGTVRMLAPSAGIEEAVTDRRSDQGLPFEVSTDTSQAAIRFSDPRSGTPLASVILLHDSDVSVLEATGPRYPVNRDPYRIQLESSSGRVEIVVTGGQNEGTSVTLATPHGTTLLEEPGHYIVETTADRTRVTVNRGIATIRAPLTNALVEVPAGHRTTIDRSQDLPTIVAGDDTLLTNGDFSEPFVEGWTFYDDSVLPAGAVANLPFDGRNSLAIDRSAANWPGVTLDHGETGLRQQVDKDVRGYSYLELRGTFLVEEQSLSTCGQAGSECPMMIRIKYIDVQGIEREYIQGFYAYHDPSRDYPLTCDTCRTEHERINLGTWYTFKSGNLFTVLPPEQKPAIIQQVRFYASGHAYKVYVSEMQLLSAS